MAMPIISKQMSLTSMNGYTWKQERTLRSCKKKKKIETMRFIGQWMKD